MKKTRKLKAVLAKLAVDPSSASLILLVELDIPEFIFSLIQLSSVYIREFNGHETFF